MSLARMYSVRSLLLLYDHNIVVGAWLPCYRGSPGILAKIKLNKYLKINKKNEK